MGKASKRKKGVINEVPGDQSRHQKELRTPQKSTLMVDLHKIVSSSKFVPVFILLFVSFAVYFNALSAAFVHDDKSQIVDNPWIRDIRSMPTIFSKSVWSFQPGIITNYYRPLMHIIYMLNYYVFGLNPWGFHLVNILFHCGTSVLVFLIIRLLLNENRDSMSPVYLSPPFIAAMLFASHPIHTEAVTWIAGLPDVAFTFFYLLSLYFYILFRDGVRRGYLLSILSFLAATLFKEPALTLPVMLIAYDYLMKKSDETIFACVMRYIPYAAASGVYLLARHSALKSFAPIESYADLSTYQLIINVFPLFTEYLASLLWPFNLNFWHSFHPVSSIFEATGIFSLAVTAIFLAVAAAAYGKNKVVLFGLLLLVVPLLPVFYIKAIGGKPFAERYLYLPSVGYVLVLAIFLSWIREKLPRLTVSTAAAFVMIFGSYSVGTIFRNEAWSDDLVLWTDTVKKSPDSSPAHYNLGIAYRSKDQLDRAIAEYQTALRLKPDFVKAHNNLGIAYRLKGQLDMAITEFETALRLKPDYAEAYNNLGVAYASKGQLDRAIAEYQTALRLKRNYAEAHNNLGVAYRSKGQLDGAIAEFQTALRLKPDDAEARNNLGVAYASKGQLDGAIAEFQTALRLKPDDAETHVNLGIAYQSKGQLDRAIAEFRAALRLKPDFNEARWHLNDIVSRQR